MSMVTLLADFPQYSARKIRKLARQIALVHRLTDMVALGSESGLLKSIEDDLMEFNLMQARTEEQLNDDLAQETSFRPEPIQVQLLPQVEEVKVTVTPLEEAHEAFRHFVAYVSLNSDIRLHPEWESKQASFRGSLNSRAWTATKKVTHEDEGSHSVAAGD